MRWCEHPPWRPPPTLALLPRQVSATYHFVVKTDVASTLVWSGNATAAPTETLTHIDAAAAAATTPPVTVELWTAAASGVAWTCATPPCMVDFESGAVGPLGESAASIGATTLSGDGLGGEEGVLPPIMRIDGQEFAAPVASRWSGSFRAPVTGDCAFTVTSGGAAQLYLGGVPVASITSIASITAPSTTRTVSLTAHDWYDFELLHYLVQSPPPHPFLFPSLPAPTPHPLPPHTHCRHLARHRSRGAPSRCGWAARACQTMPRLAIPSPSTPTTLHAAASTPRTARGPAGTRKPPLTPPSRAPSSSRPVSATGCSSSAR